MTAASEAVSLRMPSSLVEASGRSVSSATSRSPGTEGEKGTAKEVSSRVYITFAQKDGCDIIMITREHYMNLDQGREREREKRSRRRESRSDPSLVPSLAVIRSTSSSVPPYVGHLRLYSRKYGSKSRSAHLYTFSLYESLMILKSPSCILHISPLPLFVLSGNAEATVS